MPALVSSGTRILGTNIRRGAAAPCCDPHLTVASSARRYCGAFTELSITAALTSTGTRILGTNIDLLSSFLRLSSDRSRCIGLGQLVAPTLAQANATGSVGTASQEAIRRQARLRALQVSPSNEEARWYLDILMFGIRVSLGSNPNGIAPG